MRPEVPPMHLPALMLLMVLAMGAGVHSQNVTAPPPIIIQDCPTEGVTGYAPFPSGTRVFWNTPYSLSTQIGPESNHQSGDFFNLGVTEVFYAFFDDSGNMAECVFNVTVVLQCPDASTMPCNNGLCVPQSTSCDGFNDCGDGLPFGSDEGYGECPRNFQCTSNTPTLYASCLSMGEWTDAVGATQQNSTGNTVFMFKAPEDATDTTYLFKIQANISELIDLGRNELEVATIFVTIDMPASSETETVQAFVSSGDITQQFLLDIDLRRPLPVNPSEVILVTMVFDDDILRGRPPFPIERACLTCVSLRYATFTPGCENSTCFDAFVTWKNTLLSTMSSGPINRPCGVAEQNEIIEGLYDSCLDPPEFEFVSPSQSSSIEDRIVLKCIARGQVPALVEWYMDTDGQELELMASGFGFATLEVYVTQSPQSFICILDETLRYDETVTVSLWSEECSSLQFNVQNFLLRPENPCLTLDQISGFSSLEDPSRPSFSFTTPSASSVALGFLVDSAALIPSGGEGSFLEGPPGDGSSETGLLLSLRLSIAMNNLARARRDVNQAVVFEREYPNFYLPAAGSVTFDLFPPVPLDPDTDVLIIVDLGLFGFIPFQQEVPPPQLFTLRCGQSNDSSCEDYFQAWSQAQQAFAGAGCSDESNLALEAYRICQGLSAGEPKIIIPPRSVDVASTAGIDNEPVLRTTLTCFIENAVEYNWYKVAPTPGRQFIKTGSTLSFEIVPSDQGSYVCAGKGGVPYDDITVETEPAILTIAGFSMFKVTGALANVPFESNLTDPNSETFLMLKIQIEEQFLSGLYEYFGFNLQAQLDVIAFRAGSVIFDLIAHLFVGESGMGDGELAELLASGILVDQPEAIQVANDSLSIVNLVSCLEEQVAVSGVYLTFPQMRVQQTAETVERCPQFTAKAGMPRATRECRGDLLTEAQWMELVLQDCSEGEDVNMNLEDLSMVDVTSENADEIARETAILTSNYTEVDTTGIMATANILEKIVEAGEPTTEIAVDIVTVVNNILQIDEETYEDLGNDNSPSRIVIVLETYITALQMSGAAGNLSEVRSDLAVVAVIVPQDSLRLGLGFAAIPDGTEEVDSLTEKEVMVYNEPGNIPIAEVSASIQLPPEILDYVTPGDSVPISFFLYVNSKLFRSPTLRSAEVPGEFRRAVGSSVIAATVEGVRIENLPMNAPVASAFLPVNVSGPDEMVNGSECVFWDFTMNDGFGDWSSEGCQQVSDINGRTVCHCDHLTSFAVIVDIYGNQMSVALSIISKIGCAVSIVALIITIITYLAVKKLRTKRPQQILICLCFALLGLYLVFLAGIDATASRVGCIIVAVLIHYFTLAAITWMAVEATNMYLLFVRVLNANVSHFMLGALIAGWGLPLLVVVVILAVDYTNYESTNYCFLRPGNAFYFGQILLIGLVLLYNFIIFTMVMRRLTCARKSISSTSDQSKRQEVMRRLQNAIAISVLLGLTWVFGLLSLIQTANFVFQVFFCIFNSLQGLMIFILFCLRQKEVRDAWAEFLRCKRGRAADYSKGTGTRSRDQIDSHAHGTIPLTNQSTNSSDTR